MLLESLFGGGQQSTAPSQQPPSGQSPGEASGGTPSGGTEEPTTPPPAENGQADPIYDEEPGDTDAGTYPDLPPTTSEDSTPVDQPADDATPAQEPTSEPAPASEEMSASDPATVPAAESGETDGGVVAQPADQPTAPVATAPEEPVPAPVGSLPNPTEETTPVADVNTDSGALRDFVTPFLADLEEIRQRQTASTSDARAENRGRAVAAIQDQLAGRLLDELAFEKASTKSPSLLDDNRAQAEQPLSLVNRWYAEG